MSTTSGIDIGSDSIKAVVVRGRGKSGLLEVLAAGTMPIGDIGRLPDSEDKLLAIGEKLKELVHSARLKAKTRRVGASGGATSIRYLQLPPVPPWRLEALVKYEVEERSEEKELNAFDYHIMDVPETNGQYTTIIGMARESYIAQLQGIAKSSGLGEVDIDLEAAALYAAYYHGHGYDADKTVAIADIGADDITLVVCRNGALFYARTTLGGGHRFTQNLADDLKVEFGEAEELKKTVGEIVFDIAPSAASGARNPRLTRVPLRAPGASQVRPSGTGDAGALSAAGTPAVGDEARRARAPEASRLAGKPGAPGASKTQPTPEPEKQAPPAAEASASPKRMAVPMATGLNLDDLELDLTPGTPPPAPAPAKEPSAPPAPVPAPAAAKPAAAPAPVKETVDDLDLQLDEPEKPAPAKPSASTPAAPQFTAGGTQILARPPQAPQRGPTIPLRVKPAEPEVPDLDLDEPDSAPAKTVVVPAPTASQFSAPSISSSVPDAPEGGADDTPDDRDKRRRQMSAALVREAAGLCAAIENVVLSCKTQIKQPNFKIDRVYLSGGGSKLKGLPEFMSRRLRVEVQPLEPLRGLNLERLPPEAARELKAEQHTLAIALGLALSNEREGAHNFLLWPKAYKDRKEFWARGAYLYYAAAAAAVMLGVVLYTPYRNTLALVENARIADEAARAGDSKNGEIRELEKVTNELRHRVTAVGENVQSGDFFLNVLAELKNKTRVSDDIYLTSISTRMPFAVVAEAEGSDKLKTESEIKDKREEMKRLAALNKEPDTFQAQRRIFIRGFARGPAQEGLVPKIEGFYHSLVPYPDEPDHPQNVFKDIRPIFYSKIENQQGKNFLKEFVLEAYTEKAMGSAPAETAPASGKAGKGTKGPRVKGAREGVAPTNPAPAAGPAAALPAEKAPPVATPPAVARPAPAVQPAPVAQPAPAAAQPPVVAQPIVPVQPTPATPGVPAQAGQQPAADDAQAAQRAALMEAWKKLFNEKQRSAVQPPTPPATPPAPAVPVTPDVPKKKRELVMPPDGAGGK